MGAAKLVAGACCSGGETSGAACAMVCCGIITGMPWDDARTGAWFPMIDGDIIATCGAPTGSVVWPTATDL